MNQVNGIKFTELNQNKMERNKIESAIYDVKLHITEKERVVLILQTELKSLRTHLEVLERIEKDDKIPHELNKSE